MTLTKCTICTNPTTTKCSKCKSATYCSPQCQKLDFPLHKIICSKLVEFIGSNPRPADEYLSTHKLGILFPEESTSPELILHRNIIHPEDMDAPYCKTYGDVTVADLRFALDFLGHDAKLYEPEKENRFFIRDEKNWIRGVKISCDGDMKVLGKKRFRDVMVSSYHEIGIPPHAVSNISKHMGMTIWVYKCPKQKKVVQVSNADLLIGAFKNGNATVLMMNANPEDEVSWGSVESSQWDREMTPTVLVVREDLKPINAKQIETLSQYCKEVLRQTMHSSSSVITNYMKSSRFEKFFELFKNEKIAKGDKNWENASPPPRG
ncbi:hypothetical protein IFR05_016299 [Cadophora sp. M221]|nr:hypothetical protein IFR05_016299 [Cadophora sp. M221]